MSIQKETLLTSYQLSDSQGILSATVYTITVNAQNGDWLTLNDGTTSRKYYFGTGSGDVQVTIGASIADSLTNLAAAITGDGSGVWNGYYTAALTDIAANLVIIVKRTAGTGKTSLFGDWTSQYEAAVGGYYPVITEYNSQSYTVAVALTKADPVYITASGTAGKALANDDAKILVSGIALTNAASGVVDIVSSGLARDVLSGATPGTTYYLAAAGGLTTTAPTTEGEHIIQIGFAHSATDLLVLLQYLGKN